MIQALPGSHDAVLGFRVAGNVTADDRRKRGLGLAGGVDDDRSGPRAS